MNKGTPTPLLLRSMLFVPGDSEKKIEKGAAQPADALILDLEDSVAPARKPHARELVTEFLAQRRSAAHSLWVRINPLGTVECSADIARVMAAGPDGIVLPKVGAAGGVIELGRWVGGDEQRFGIAGGAPRIKPL